MTDTQTCSISPYARRSLNNLYSNLDQLKQEEILTKSHPILVLDHSGYIFLLKGKGSYDSVDVDGSIWGFLRHNTVPIPLPQGVSQTAIRQWVSDNEQDLMFVLADLHAEYTEKLPARIMNQPIAPDLFLSDEPTRFRIPKLWWADFVAGKGLAALPLHGDPAKLMAARFKLWNDLFPEYEGNPAIRQRTVDGKTHLLNLYDIDRYLDSVIESLHARLQDT